MTFRQVNPSLFTSMLQHIDKHATWDLEGVGVVGVEGEEGEETRQEERIQP